MRIDWGKLLEFINPIGGDPRLLQNNDTQRKRTKPKPKKEASLKKWEIIVILIVFFVGVCLIVPIAEQKSNNQNMQQSIEQKNSAVQKAEDPGPQSSNETNPVAKNSDSTTPTSKTTTTTKPSPTTTSPTPIATTSPATTPEPTCNTSLRDIYTNKLYSDFAYENSYHESELRKIANYYGGRGLGSSSYYQDAVDAENIRHDYKIQQLTTDYQLKLADIYCL